MILTITINRYNVIVIMDSSGGQTMKAIMVMFDSLNRHLLQPYGCDWTKTPNFKRLSEHTVTFDQFYAGSLPCMPARRELHTGRYNFLHRAWGPLENYDDSMPAILRSLRRSAMQFGPTALCSI